MEKYSHIPVLLQETIRGLEMKDGDVLLDATLGGAGHAMELIKKDVTLIGLDADGEALERARVNLGNALPKEKMILEKTNFRNIDSALAKHGIEKIDKALFDLGLGSHTYETGRGFSFQKDEPLLMTLDNEATRENAVTAYAVVNEWSEETLASIIYGFGEERYSYRIARAIVGAREEKPIETTAELKAVITRAVPIFYRHGRTNPATKTFQAIRIAVNDELNALQMGIESAWNHLTSGGRMAVISFHSLEDRIVKTFFLSKEKNGEGKNLSKKPIAPSDDEVKINPRSRSAKLRIIQKI
jgi:16S rRNA (cytosine1402-N4)-methyltransferase